MTVISMIPNDTPFLPQKVADVPKDILRNFPHSKKVGNYLLGNTLGEGSFAKVKEALHIPTGERVAVKIIDKKKSREDSYVRKNLRREGKILQMIRHSNIVQLLEIMETQNSYYLVTELCRGGDLMDYISQRRKLPELEVKRYIRQIVSAVDYLHRLGILHRDLKIENLLLDEYKDMKIIDFGLSNCVKLVQTKDGPRVQEYCVTQCGSPAYAAPELLGRKKYGPQVDVWSIGVNMYAMLTGNLPFTVEPFNIKALHNKMITGQMNPLPDSVSRECRDLIKKLLNPDPDRRVTVEDILKHPWISEGHGCPLARAPCPNKMKTDLIDNSILRHMSEIQGFRVGEIIRYVTGNVPSSATAMYYLINRKLRKHYGNLRASGKIAADHRIPNKTNFAMDTMKSRPGTSNKPYTPQPTPTGTRHQVNHTVNYVRNTVNAHKGRDPDIDNDDSTDENFSRDTDDDKSGYLQNFKKRRILVRRKEADLPFSDILQTKGTNGVVQIPRANSPMKPPKSASPDKDQTTHLPRVANKYVLGNRRTVPTVVTKQNIDDKIEVKHSLEQNEARNAEKRSATDATASKEEPFRRRASTFPGKMQRPTVTLNKLLKERNATENSEKSDTNTRTRIYKTKTDHVVNNNNNTRANVPPPASPVSRKGSPYFRETPVSHTSKTSGNNNQHLVQYRRHSAIQQRIANVQKNKETEASRDLIQDDDVTSAIAKHVIARPSRTNRFSRATITFSNSTHREEAIVEQVSEIPCPTPRPVSSLNIPIQSNNTFRSATPVLPSLGK